MQAEFKALRIAIELVKLLIEIKCSSNRIKLLSSAARALVSGEWSKQLTTQLLTRSNLCGLWRERESSARNTTRARKRMSRSDVRDDDEHDGRLQRSERATALGV